MSIGNNYATSVKMKTRWELLFS